MEMIRIALGWLHNLVDPELLGQFVAAHSHSIYFILFAIVFCETGLVVTPFLPGDSMLFAAGAVAAAGGMDVTWLVVILSIAAIAGDTLNYWIGHAVGYRAFTSKSRFLKKEYLDRTHKFFERHGGKTIILARFVPIIRTFAPFVAGIGAMSYGKFILYNIVGGIVWVSAFCLAGYLVGTNEWVKAHFSVVLVIIVIISVLPMIVEVIRARYEKD